MGRYRDNRCLKTLCGIVYYLPIAFTMAILTWGEYSYGYQFCFKIVDNIPLRIFFCGVANTLLFFFLWAFWQTVIAPIGGVSCIFDIPQEVKDSLRDVPDLASYNKIIENFVNENKIPASTRNFDGGIRYCIRCAIVKPDRTHHCSTCDKCVLKFDHHCPWVNTCINFTNYKFFVLFNCYGFLLCIFVFFSLLPYFIRWFRSMNPLRDYDVEFVSVLVLFVVSGLFSISLGCLAFYHLYLISKNKTTNETFGPPRFSYGVDKNIYNLGCKRNFREVFGSNSLLWFIPVFTSTGDGMLFPTNNGCHICYSSGKVVDDRVCCSSSTDEEDDKSELLVGVEIV